MRNLDGDAKVKVIFDEPEDLLRMKFEIRYAADVTVTLYDDVGDILLEKMVRC